MTDEFNNEQSVSAGIIHEMRGTVEALGYLKLFAESARGESTMPQIAALADYTITRLHRVCEVLARDLPSLAASSEYRHYREATQEALALVRPYEKGTPDIGRFETFVTDLDRIVTRLKLAHQVLTGFARAEPSKKFRRGSSA